MQVTEPGAVVDISQPVDRHLAFEPLPVVVTLIAAVIVAPGATWTLDPPFSVTELMDLAAIRYGPTNGPPSPTGGAPNGCTSSVAVSASARAICNLPFPVSSGVPAGSAFLASLPTITPLLSDGSTARMNAAAPATKAAEAELPLHATYPPFLYVLTISTPGAAMKIVGPKLLLDARASFWSVAETPTTLLSPAGNVAVFDASFPAAATSTTPCDHA